MPIYHLSGPLDLFGSGYSCILSPRRIYPGQSSQVYSWYWSCCWWFNFLIQVISWIFTPERIQFLSKGIKNWVTIFSYQGWFSVIFDSISLILVSYHRVLVDISPFQYLNKNKQRISWVKPTKRAASPKGT